MMEKITILHAFPTWLPQTQTWMYSQVKAMQEMGVDAHIVCERIQNCDQFHVANIHCFAEEPKWRQFWEKGLRLAGLRRHLNYLADVGGKAGAHIVHSHFGNVGWSNLGALCRLDSKHVVTFYGFDVAQLPQSKLWRKRYNQLFSQADMFLCEGGHMAKILVGLGCPESKVRVHHLGVDVDRIKLSPRHWHTGQTLRVLIAASFREKKGIPCAIQALSMVRSKLNVELTVIGDATDEPESQSEKKRILEILGQTGMISNTTFLGFQSYHALLQQAYSHHIFLHPSISARDGDTEGGAPVSIIEMLASGMPVVSTLHCDIPEVMGSELNFLLAPEKDACRLAEVILDLTSRPEKWSEIAISSRRRVEEEYNLVKQCERLMDLYQQLLQPSSDHECYT